MIAFDALTSSDSVEGEVIAKALSKEEVFENDKEANDQEAGNESIAQISTVSASRRSVALEALCWFVLTFLLHVQGTG